MIKHDEELLAQLTKIAYKDLDGLAEYDKILLECKERLMSKGSALCGMFFPEPELSKYFIYKGKLTKNEKKKHFVYHFDDKKRLRITERWDGDGDLLDYIFYYYYDQSIEIIHFNLKEKLIDKVGFIDYENGSLIRFVDTDVLLYVRNNEPVKYYVEYDFIKDKEYVLERHFALDVYSDGREWLVNTKMKKR